MHFDIGSHGKSRTRSVQLEKGLDIAVGDVSKVESVKDGPAAPPVPAARSSSLPSGKENTNSVRHYRSMLDVEGPPTLGPVKTFSYDELYVENAKSSISQAPLALAKLLLDILALSWRAHSDSSPSLKLTCP